MLSREQHLQFCKVCTNRKMDPEKGLVCGLTDEYADFEDSCESFTQDVELMRKNQIKRKEERKEMMQSDFTFGLSRFGIKNGFVAGFLLIVVGTIWLAIGLSKGLIFWYPLILIVMGVTAIVIAVFHSVRRSMARDQAVVDPENEVVDQ